MPSGNNLIIVDSDNESCGQLNIDGQGSCSSDSDSSGGISTTQHNNLQGLQGGLPSQRYHLTKDKYEAIQGAETANKDNPFSTVEDLTELETELQGEISDLTDQLETVKDRLDVVEQDIQDINTEIDNLQSSITDLDGRVVHIIGDETIQDTKTFIESPQVPNGIIGLDALNYQQLLSTTIVTPSISQTWTAFKNDGTTPYEITTGVNTSTTANLIVDKGAKVNLSATYSYGNAGVGQGLPTGASGNFGSTLPGPNTQSAPLTVNTITDNTTFSVTLSKPKTGLTANTSTGQVTYASGNDTSTSSISVSFRSRSYLGYATTSSLTASQILALANKAFATSKARTVSNITSTGNTYTYYVYEAAFGDLTGIILDGAAPVLGAFTKLPDVTITNDAGISIVMRVYKSNAPNAFSNNTLAFS